jgi:mono/diheme cytochrome c family protein
MFNRTRFLLLSILVLSLLTLTLACGGGGAATQPAPTQPPAQPAGDAAAGKDLFASAGCIACHTITGNSQATGTVGPNLSHIATDAAKIITESSYTGKAKTVAEYLQESIVDPNAFLYPTCPTGPCQPNIMPQNFKDTLSSQQIDDLVAYLLTLK